MEAIRGNTLPSAEQIRLAIREWWVGGGAATVIVNVCRRDQASLAEAEELARRLADRANNGWNHFTDVFVSEQLEIVRAVGAVLQSKEDQEAKSPHPPIGSPEWHRRATEKALANWRKLMGDIPMPSDPDEAERLYKAKVYGR